MVVIDELCRLNYTGNFNLFQNFHVNAVCPFYITGSKMLCFRYNFHLFPRDEMKVGMPAYSFSCQSSYLMSMAQEGFDFNACIYDGISYLSREQESTTKDHWLQENPVTIDCTVQSSPTHSVADSIFTQRIKSRVRNWVDAYTNANKKTEDPLISSFRKIFAGGELHGSRPSLNIDVCSECQVQLTLAMLKDFDDVVPLLIPAKKGGTQSVRVILTSSAEDRTALENEIQKVEDEQNTRARGFREVIDLISSSEKPLVAHNSLNDLAIIHSKFLGPLPPTVSEFRSSLNSVFPKILDVNHLGKEIYSLQQMNNLPTAISYLKKRSLLPMDIEIAYQALPDEVKIHGHNVLKISELFAKLSTLQKSFPESKGDKGQYSSTFESYIDIFSACSTSEDPAIEDVGIWTKNKRKTSAENLVFLWGFGSGMTAGTLKEILSGSHEIFLQDFDVRLVDRSCAIVVFWNAGFSNKFLELLESEGSCSGSLVEMIAEGLRATGYHTYQKACQLGLWEADLADSLEKALEKPEHLSEAHCQGWSVIDWNSDDMIHLEDL
ncbi:mRNA polyadenylation factor [Lithospermum erythrorhizon]|uniref:mRNA polyadenylation factor n=1 Tax=Lithospermum erythrorhizon TaxID=34254 RepID=A0AAV3QG12_LITER